MIHYFTDPVLWAPTWGSILMCISSSLIGVVALLRKKCLLAETLSHASYPGIVLSIFVLAPLVSVSSEIASFGILLGAFFSSLLGLWVVHFLEMRLKIKSDAALCFALSLFFGVGILAASHIQKVYPVWYNQAHVFLYGQVATMVKTHVLIYAFLLAVVVGFLFVLFRPLKLINFDRDFAKTLGVHVLRIDTLLFFLLALSIVIGMRSVGVILMSGMLIAPAVAARQLTNKLSLLFFFAAGFGLISGFLGNVLSVEFSRENFSLPTGPMILLVASFLCLLSLLFAPKAGLVSRLIRISRFKNRCLLENALKGLWRGKPFEELPRFLQRRLEAKKWVANHRLTQEGEKKAAQIVRLHRLWEVYLVSLGQGAEKVHRSAEEMEHIITPDLEKELTEYLRNPQEDPHAQPIPAAHHV